MSKHDLLWPDSPPPPDPAGVVLSVIDEERERLYTVQSALKSCDETVGALKKQQAEILQRIAALEEALLAVTKKE
jgi:hypothetical protein